jgi:SAM-dependent methyltransferase
MGIIGGPAGYRLLKLINPGGQRDFCNGNPYQSRSKIEALFGPEIWSDIQDKVVIDFGCGTGADAIELAHRGAKRVIGLDIREKLLSEARSEANRAGVSDRCFFSTETTEKADVIFSIDAFEHFDDPAQVLRIMRRLIKDTGSVRVEFGPPWYHPLGGHLFSVFPWAHLIFTENALIRWRSDFKSDGATRFSEVAGGLNQLTIRRFEKLVSESEFQFSSFQAVPIRRLRPISSPLTREFFTSVVRCRLVPSKNS